MKKITFTFFNLGFLFSSFLGLTFQDLTTASLFQDLLKPTLAENVSTEYNQKALETRSGLTLVSDKILSEELDTYAADSGLTIKYSRDESSHEVSAESIDQSSLKHCKSLVYKTLMSLPQEPVAQLKHLTLYFNDEGRRGLGGGSTIVLRCQNVTDEELVGVLTHEIGHILDTGVMQGSAASGESGFMDGKLSIYQDDVSSEFYAISFSDTQSLKADSTDLDFVSGYAMTDPFEDFAESFAYYILHGQEFRLLAKYNDRLQQKYDFLKYKVFAGKEYFNGDLTSVKSVAERHFDVTVLPYDLREFFVT